jgi:glycosyltransferase involved in cell wall biosynthesis
MKTARRILIVSGSHLCRNPRVVKEAETLAQSGYDVSVLTLASHEPSIEIDRRIEQSAAFKVSYLNFRNGLIGRARRLMTRLAREALIRTGVESPLTLGPAPALLKAARSRDWDLLIGHTEPGLWVASQLIGSNRAVAADFEDWHSEDLPVDQRKGRPGGLLRTTEHTLLNRSDLVMTTSRSLANALAERYAGRRAEVIYNAFPLQGNPRTEQNALAAPALIWFSQTVGPSRGLEEFLSGWTLSTSNLPLTLLGTVRDGFKDKLFNTVPASKRSLLKFRPAVPPEKLPRLLAKYDLGLAIETANIRNRDLTITNKILQYMNAGLGILATPTQGQKEVLDAYPRAGRWLDLSQPQETAAGLDALSTSPDLIRKMQAAARAGAEERFCWEIQSEKLTRLVQQVLDRRP